MELRYNNFIFNIEPEQVTKAIEKILNSLSKEELIEIMFDNNKSVLDLAEIFREEITEMYKQTACKNFMFNK